MEFLFVSPGVQLDNSVHTTWENADLRQAFDVSDANLLQMDDEIPTSGI